MMFGHMLDGVRLLARSPSDVQMETWPAGTRIIRTTAGRLRVRDTGGDNPVIVMVPDGPCVIEHYEALIAELAGSFRVICFDLPGFGFSYPRPMYDFGLDATVDVVLAVLDASDVSRATLSFSCVNSFYALAVTQAVPDRVERLVLCQTPSKNAMDAWVRHNIPAPLVVPFVGQAAVAAGAKTLATKWFDKALPRDSPVGEQLRQVATHALKNGACFCLASVVQGMLPVKATQLAGTDVPTTMIWGNRDWSHKTTDFESFREHVPNATIEIFDGCGHFPNLERPEQFAECLRRR